MAMVGNITSLTNNGLRDWLIQRVSALVLAAYTIFLITFIVMHPNLDFMTWQALFSHPVMRIASAVVLLNLILHAWIGLWTVSTDYLKSTVVRVSFQMFVVILLLAAFIWGIDILWSV